MKLCYPSNINRGLRFNPTVQQGGTGTIQQSIYLTHLNPCGVNLLIYEKIGATQITYFQLKQFLDAILQTEEVEDFFLLVRQTGTAFLYDPNIQTQLRYLFTAMEWGKAVYRNRPQEEYPGYFWRVSVFDYNGVMVWDSFTPNLKCVDDLGGGVLEFFKIPLVQEFRSYSPNPNTIVVNPFIGPEQKDIQLYGICNNPSFVPFMDPNNAIAQEAIRSSYLVNQVALPESMMAIASLLTDPANTRVFGVTRYGFSSRQNTFNSAYLGYHCVYLNDIFTSDGKDTLIETMFVRLSLEQDILTPPSPVPP